MRTRKSGQVATARKQAHAARCNENTMRQHLAAIAKERDRLRTTMQQVLADAKSQDVLPEWWPMMEAALKTPNVRVQGPAACGRSPETKC
jgi:hypothetical protein